MSKPLYFPITKFGGLDEYSHEVLYPSGNSPTINNGLCDERGALMAWKGANFSQFFGYDTSALTYTKTDEYIVQYDKVWCESLGIGVIVQTRNTTEQKVYWTQDMLTFVYICTMGTPNIYNVNVLSYKGLVFLCNGLSAIKIWDGHAVSNLTDSNVSGTYPTYMAGKVGLVGFRNVIFYGNLPNHPSGFIYNNFKDKEGFPVLPLYSDSWLTSNITDLPDLGVLVGLRPLTQDILGVFGTNGIYGVVWGEEFPIQAIKLSDVSCLEGDYFDTKKLNIPLAFDTDKKLFLGMDSKTWKEVLRVRDTIAGQVYRKENQLFLNTKPEFETGYGIVDKYGTVITAGGASDGQTTADIIRDYLIPAVKHNPTFTMTAATGVVTATECKVGEYNEDDLTDAVDYGGIGLKDECCAQSFRAGGFLDDYNNNPYMLKHTKVMVRSCGADWSALKYTTIEWELVEYDKLPEKVTDFTGKILAHYSSTVREHLINFPGAVWIDINWQKVGTTTAVAIRLEVDKIYFIRAKYVSTDNGTTSKFYWYSTNNDIITSAYSEGWTWTPTQNPDTETCYVFKNYYAPCSLLADNANGQSRWDSQVYEFPNLAKALFVSGDMLISNGSNHTPEQTYGEIGYRHSTATWSPLAATPTWGYSLVNPPAGALGEQQYTTISTNLSTITDKFWQFFFVSGDTQEGFGIAKCKSIRFVYLTTDGRIACWQYQDNNWIMINDVALVMNKTGWYKNATIETDKGQPLKLCSMVDIGNKLYGSMGTNQITSKYGFIELTNDSYQDASGNEIKITLSTGKIDCGHPLSEKNFDEMWVIEESIYSKATPCLLEFQTEKNATALTITPTTMPTTSVSLIPGIRAWKYQFKESINGHWIKFNKIEVSKRYVTKILGIIIKYRLKQPEFMYQNITQ